jgi:hypothetical protein
MRNTVPFTSLQPAFILYYSNVCYLDGACASLWKATQVTVMKLKTLTPLLPEEHDVGSQRSQIGDAFAQSLRASIRRFEEKWH